MATKWKQLQALLWKNVTIFRRRKDTYIVFIVALAIAVGLAVLVDVLSIAPLVEFNYAGFEDASNATALLEVLRKGNCREDEMLTGHATPLVGVLPRVNGQLFMNFVTSVAGSDNANLFFRVYDNEDQAQRSWLNSQKEYEDVEETICGYINFPDSITESLNPQVIIRTFEGQSGLQPRAKFDYQFRRSRGALYANTNFFALQTLVETFMHEEQYKYCLGLVVDGAEYNEEVCGTFRDKKTLAEYTTLKNNLEAKVAAGTSSMFRTVSDSAFYVSPLPALSQTSALSYLGPNFALILFCISICYLFPIISVMRSEVRQNKRELLLMMGCDAVLYHVSWFIVFFVLSNALLIAIIVSWKLLGLIYFSSLSLLILITVLSTIELFCFAIFCVEIFSTLELGTIVISLIVFFSYMFASAINEGSSLEFTTLVYLTPVAVLVAFMTTAFSMEGQMQGLTWSTLSYENGNLTIAIAFTFLICGSILYLLLAVLTCKVYSLFLSRSPSTETAQSGASALWPLDALKMSRRVAYLHGFTVMSDVLRGATPKGLWIQAREIFNKHSKESAAAKPTKSKVKEGVHIQEVTKKYKKGDTTITAVDNLTATLKHQEIIALLGENGAGKSTLIKMLSGQIAPTSGQISIFGLDMFAEKAQGRQLLGVCPQFDAHWDNLTVFEHLKLFAMLKSLAKSAEEIKNAATAAMKEVNLEARSDFYPPKLSGGMKRRLSVGLAFVGNPKFVLLDEPSSGLDPFARESLWKILKKSKENRTILVSTHYTEEAEAIGDTVAMMLSGKLICFGSAPSLKADYGCGYDVTFQKKAKEDSLRVLSAIEKLVPEMRIELETVSQYIINVPLSSLSLVAPLLRLLEAEKENKSIGYFSIDNASLESVFCEAVKRAEDETTSIDQVNVNVNQRKKEDTGTSLDGFFDTRIDSTFARFKTVAGTIFLKRLFLIYRSPMSIVYQILLPVLLFVIINWISLLTIDAVLSNVPLKIEPLSITASASKGNIPVLPYGVSTNTEGAEEFFSKGVPELWDSVEAVTWNSVPDFGSRNISPLNTMRLPAVNPVLLRDAYTFSMNVFHDYRRSKGVEVYGATAILEDPTLEAAPANSATPINLGGNVIVWYSTRALHALPTYFDLFFRLLAIEEGRKARTQITSYSLVPPLQTALADSSVSYVSVITYGSIASIFVVYWATTERTSKLKLLQTLAGTQPWVYWLINYAADYLLLYVGHGMVVLALYLLDTSGVIRPRLGTLTGVYSVFICATVIQTYVWSFITGDVEKNITILIVVNFATGIIGFIIAFLKVLAEITTAPTEDSIVATIVLVIRPLGVLAPVLSLGYCMGALVILSLDDGVFPTDSIDIWGEGVAFLGGCVCFYVVVLALIEYFSHYGAKLTSMKQTLFPSLSSFGTKSLSIDRRRSSMDLAREERGEVPSLVVSRLGKKYAKWCKKGSEVTALKKLSITAFPGNYISLIGANGAGKTSLMYLLVGWITKTTGTIALKGYTLEESRRRYLSCIAYCPQENSLWPELTVLDNMLIFGLLHGYIWKNLKDSIAKQLERFGLMKYCNVKYKNLSGGTQRKINVLVSLMGDRQLVVLDEPAAGLDPLSRRRLVKFLSEWVREATFKPIVMVSTHSFEEVEDIADKMLLLEKGRMCYYNSLASLKDQYKSKLVLKVKFAEIEPNVVKETVKALSLSEGTDIAYEEAKRLFENFDTPRALSIAEAQTFSSPFEVEWGNSEEAVQAKIGASQFARWLLAIGYAEKLFEALATRELPVQLKHSSELNFSFCIDSDKPDVVAYVFELLTTRSFYDQLGFKLDTFTCTGIPLTEMVFSLSETTDPDDDNA